MVPTGARSGIVPRLTTTDAAAIVVDIIWARDRRKKSRCNGDFAAQDSQKTGGSSTSDETVLNGDQRTVMVGLHVTNLYVDGLYRYIDVDGVGKKA